MLSFDRVTSSDLLLLNDFDIPTLLDRSSGSRSSPNISFALFSLALSCSWEVLQNLCSNHLPILLTLSLSLVFRPNERLPSLNFQKARQDDFAFYFNSHCPSAEEYSSLFLCFAAVLFTSLTLNALLTIWCSGQTALFLSLLAKTNLAYLPTALSVASRPPLFFSAGLACSSFRHSARSLLVSAAPTSLPFLFSYLTLALSSPSCSLLHLSFYFNLCQKLFLSSPVLSGYNGPPNTRFFRTTTRPMSWPDGERYLFLLQSLVVSLLLSLVSTLVFSRTGSILSHLNSSTHRFPRFPPRNLCFCVVLAVFSLAFAATCYPKISILFIYTEHHYI